MSIPEEELVTNAINISTVVLVYLLAVALVAIMLHKINSRRDRSSRLINVHRNLALAFAPVTLITALLIIAYEKAQEAWEKFTAFTDAR